MRLLVTGFGPFPRMPRNPSGGLALAIAASPRLRLHGIAARACVLTTAYATLAAELDPLLGDEPDAVLLVGVAARSTKVRIERHASSRRSTLFPDTLGDMPERLETGAGDRTPKSRRTDVNTIAALRRLPGRSLPARDSRDAGRYLCNAAYFRALARRGPTLFAHIPKEPVPRRIKGSAPLLVGTRWRRRLTAALVDVAIDMIRTARTARPFAFSSGEPGPRLAKII